MRFAVKNILSRCGGKFSIFVALVLVMVSCIDEALLPGHPDSGVLTVGEVSVAESARGKNSNNVTTRSGRATRGEAEVTTGDFVYTITSFSTGEQMLVSTVGEAPKLLNMPSGEYILEVRSPWAEPDVAWDDTPNAISYVLRQNFTIRQDKVTDLGDLVCPISTIVVGVRISENMQKVMPLDAGWTATVKVSNHEPVTFTQDETRLACFRAEAVENTLVWDFEGEVFNYPPIDQSVRIPVGGHAFVKGVKGGEQRMLTFDVTGKGQAGMGEFEVSAECEPFDVVFNVEVGEEPIGQVPVEMILPAGYTFESGNTVYYTTVFDKQGEVVAPLDIEVVTAKGIATLSITIESDNAQIAALEVPSTEDAVGKKEWTVELSDLVARAFDVIGLNGTGEMSVTVAMTGVENGVSMQKTIEMTLVENSGVELLVVGRGFNIKNRMMIPKSQANNTQVIVDIVSSQGIREMWVTIEATNPSFFSALVSMGLDQPFNLADLGALESTIASLGLPYGDTVVGTFTETDPLVFNITSFVSLLFLYDSPYNADFTLRVVDNDGATATETIQLGLTN